MSLEAWGDEGDARELPDGCWSEVTVEVVLDCIRDLLREPFYEGWQMANGISVRFLARLTILQGEAGLIPTDGAIYREAEAMFREPTEREAFKARLREHGPYPGMAEAFETRYGAPFDHADWRAEAATWAEAWKAATRVPAQVRPQEPTR